MGILRPKINKLKWLKKKKTQTGKKTKPVASDRLLRKCLFILCSGWFISVRGMDLIQEFINKLQMQSLFVFWHQRGPRKWIGVWTNWHHSHEHSGTKFSDTEVMSSIGSSPASFRLYLITIPFFLLFTLSQPRLLSIYFIVQVNAHSHLNQIMLVLSSHWAHVIRFCSVSLEDRESWAKAGIIEYHVARCICCIRYSGPTSSFYKHPRIPSVRLPRCFETKQKDSGRHFPLKTRCRRKRGPTTLNKQTSCNQMKQ